ncbi:MAG: hypothetical protein KBD06_00090 [Candidatus Pacebacteria bacterium]|nr:hypothetical protein [Candidatus Paceibacterota bacterium]
MKVLVFGAALITIVGFGQMYEKGVGKERKAKPAVEKVDDLRSQSSLAEHNAVARRPERPTPPARFQKLFWIPAFEYRGRRFWI